MSIIHPHEKDGFNVTVKYDGDFGTNTDDETYKKSKDAIFIQISENPIGPSDLIKVPAKDFGWTMESLYVFGYRKVKVLVTDNENAGRLDYSDYDGDSGFSPYHLTDRFKSTFGPFSIEREIDLCETVKESSVFLPDDTIEVDEPGFKQYIRNGVRYYEIT